MLIDAIFTAYRRIDDQHKPLTTDLFGDQSCAKQMVIMEAIINLAFSYRGTADLNPIATLRYQQIAALQAVFFKFVCQYLDLFDHA
jgi:hypothetical protein